MAFFLSWHFTSKIFCVEKPGNSFLKSLSAFPERLRMLHGALSAASVQGPWNVGIIRVLQTASLASELEKQQLVDAKQTFASPCKPLQAHKFQFWRPCYPCIRTDDPPRSSIHARGVHTAPPAPVGNIVRYELCNIGAMLLVVSHLGAPLSGRVRCEANYTAGGSAPTISVVMFQRLFVHDHFVITLSNNY